MGVGRITGVITGNCVGWAVDSVAIAVGSGGTGVTVGELAVAAGTRSCTPLGSGDGSSDTDGSELVLADASGAGAVSSGSWRRSPGQIRRGSLSTCRSSSRIPTLAAYSSGQRLSSPS